MGNNSKVRQVLRVLTLMPNNLAAVMVFLTFLKCFLGKVLVGHAKVVLGQILLVAFQESKGVGVMWNQKSP